MHYNRASWANQSHQCASAWIDLDRSIELYRKTDYATEANDVLYLKAQCQLDVGDSRAALQTAEQLLASGDTTARHRALAHLARGQASWNLGKRAPGRAEVRAARDELAKLEGEENTDEVTRADRWLATHQ